MSLPKPINILSEGVPSIALLLLYPGFFFYHTAVALFSFPPVLGGFYGLVSLVFLPILLLSAYLNWRRKWLFVTGYDWLFFIFVFFAVSWALIHRYLGFGHQRDPSVTVQVLSGLTILVVNYSLFRNLRLPSRATTVFLGVSLVAMIGLMLLYQQGGFFYARRLSTAESVEAVATYQGFARSFFVTALLLLATLRTDRLSWVYSIGLAGLFLLGARSEFAVFILVGALALYLRAGVLKFAFFIAPFLVMIGLILVDFVLTEASNSRILGLLDVASDTSSNERNYLTSAAISTLLRYPVLGDYGSHVLQGGTGTYAHNLLSAWVTFGLIGFLLVVMLTLKPVVSFRWRGFVRADLLPEQLAAFIFGCAIFIMAIFAKSIFYPVFGAAWGIYGLSRDRALQLRSLSGRLVI